MSMQIINDIEKSQMKESVPEMRVGDTVVVDKVIIEGKKSRIQKFEGVIVKITGIRSRVRFTVRKVVGKFAVEKTFLLHSTQVADVKVVKKGKARRARLNYLRNRVGIKATRLKARD